MMRSVAAALAVLAAAPTWAADITVDTSPGDPGFARFTVNGEFGETDGIRFAALAKRYGRGIVTLKGPGGRLVTGLTMGEVIRERGFATRVLAGETCASACALAWLGGTARHMARSARLGFHAAYRDDFTETGSGNALIGAYMRDLGLPMPTVAYLTSAPPRDMTWLDIDQAGKLGIRLSVAEPGPDPAETGTNVDTARRPRVAWVAGAILGGSVNLRAGPGMGARIIREVRAGTKLALLDDDMGSEWSQVRLESGATGWAYTSHLRFDARPDGNAGRLHYVANVSDFLFLRIEPSQGSPERARMGLGTLLTVLEQRGEWLRVRMVGGPTGWAHSDYVTCCR